MLRRIVNNPNTNSKYRLHENGKHSSHYNNLSYMPVSTIHFWVVLALLTTCSFVFIPFFITLLSGLPSHDSSGKSQSWLDFWLVQFIVNLLGYASVLGPIYLCVYLIRSSDYDSRGPRQGCLPKFLRLLALGQQVETDPEYGEDDDECKPVTSELQPHTPKWYLGLFGCFVGLQGAYLTWGVMQELITTTKYGNEKFTDSQFLVFANRMLSGLAGVVAILLVPQPPHRAPLYEYSFCSLSNVLSSWCQYEALHFVTFPTQVIAKASKIIPVMLMGRLVSRQSYRLDEYFTSFLISIGTALFLLTSTSGSSSLATVTSLSGSALLAGYMLFDSFTSNWQGRLFKQHKLSSLQVMAGTNLISALLTTAAQLEQASLPKALAFTARHPSFLMHLSLLSLCSVVGQLILFKCIEIYGPVTFTIIMTVRQAFAILLSCLIYGHAVSSAGALGVLVLFCALFLRIYFGQRAKTSNRK